MMTTKAMKKGFAQRDFKDAGTERQFKAGDAVEVEAGAYGNYEAARLVGDAKPKAAIAATDEKPSTTDKK